MHKAVSIALTGGIVLIIIIGVSATESFSSDVSRFFSGSPTEKTVWLLLRGLVAGVTGLSGITKI